MILLDGLYFKYRRNTVFENLKWDVADDTTLCLLGKNGAGKSTLLRLISGILSEDKGSIYVDGHIPFKRNEDFLQDIFLLPEDIAPEKESAVEYAYRYGSFYPRFSLDTFLHLCDSLEVDSCRLLTKMSFGQRKKAYLAFALSLGVKHLLLDEPTNGLDIPSKSTLRELIKYRSSGKGNITIISTHEVKEIEGITDTISILDSGNIIFNGKTDIAHITSGYGTDIEHIFLRLTNNSPFISQQP